MTKLICKCFQKYIGRLFTIISFNVIFIQVAGCLVYYILSDGHVPYESTSPYSLQPMEVVKNRYENRYSLKHLGESPDMCRMIEGMIHEDPRQRPTIDNCVQQFQGKFVEDVIMQLRICNHVIYLMRCCECTPAYYYAHVLPKKHNTNIFMPRQSKLLGFSTGNSCVPKLIPIT